MRASAHRRTPAESIRETCRVIAGDELSHAELSRRIHAWALTVLDDGERARLRDAMIRAIDQLRADIAIR